MMETVTAAQRITPRTSTRKHWAMSFYQSRLWQQQRLHALHRDQYTCQDCGAAAEEVHHTTPLTPANIDDYRVSLALDALVSLCHLCHTGRHEGKAAVMDDFVFDEQGQAVPRETIPHSNVGF